MKKTKLAKEEHELALNITEDVKEIIKNSVVGTKLCLYIPNNLNRNAMIDGLTTLLTDYILPAIAKYEPSLFEFDEEKIRKIIVESGIKRYQKKLKTILVVFSSKLLNELVHALATSQIIKRKEQQ